MRQEAWCPNARCWLEATPVRAGGLRTFAALCIEVYCVDAFQTFAPGVLISAFVNLDKNGGVWNCLSGGKEHLAGIRRSAHVIIQPAEAL